MKKGSTKRKKRKYTPRKMKNQKEDGKTGDKSAMQIEVDNEIDALRKICNAIEGMDDAAKLRTFNYLKSKYAKSFPSDYSA